MYSSTGFMQKALPVLHNALSSPSLRNANHPRKMETFHGSAMKHLWSPEMRCSQSRRHREVQVGGGGRGEDKVGWGA